MTHKCVASSPPPWQMAGTPAVLARTPTQLADAVEPLSVLQHALLHESVGSFGCVRDVANADHPAEAVVRQIEQ